MSEGWPALWRTLFALLLLFLWVLLGVVVTGG